MTAAPDPDFWAGRRVFLTGHTGFKGSWMTLWLTMLGAEVKGYSLAPTTSPALFTVLELENRCDHVLGEICDITALRKELVAFQPDIVLHLAAQSLVLDSYAHPVETFQTNIMGTATLLDACRDIQTLKSIVIVTTDKCYENKSDGAAFVETDRLGGYDPYSSSKACTELVTDSYRNSFYNPEAYAEHGVSIATARAGNVVGGGDWSDNRIIPDAVRAFCSDAPLGIRMPHAVRPWQHVLEPLLGYLTLAQACYQQGPAFGGAWNFGPQPGQVVSVGEVADLAVAAWPKPAHWQAIGEQQTPKESEVLLLDSTKAGKRLGWQSNMDIKATLSMTMDWYAAYYKLANSRTILDVSKSQIDHYTSVV